MTSLGKNVFAGELTAATLRGTDVVASALSVGTVHCGGNVLTDEVDLSKGTNDVVSVYTNGSTLVFSYVQMMSALSGSFVSGSSEVKVVVSEPHDLAVGDRFFIQNSFDPTWTYAGLTAADVRGGPWTVASVQDTLTFTYTIVATATSSGTTLSFDPDIAVFRYLLNDIVNPAATWTRGTQAQSGYHQNATPQTVL